MNMSGRESNRRIRGIRGNVDLYDVCTNDFFPCF